MRTIGTFLLALAVSLPLAVLAPRASAQSYGYPSTYTYPTYNSPRNSAYYYGGYYGQYPYYYPGHANVDYDAAARYYQDLADYYESLADYYEDLADIQNRDNTVSRRTGSSVNAYYPYGGGYPSYGNTMYYPSQYTNYYYGY